MNIEKMIPENLPIRPGDHVSAATFYRLFIAEILPSHITTAIYLDCDMIALKSIASLFSTDIGNFLVGAVDHCSPRDQLRLWGEKSGTYFQAGVLVIPTESWRKQYLYRSFLKTINEDNGNICWWDQDVLNITLNNNWHRLPIWMNVCRELQNTIPREIVGEKTCLIHYSGRDKPWNKTYYLPYDEHWLRAYERLFGTKYSKPILPLSCQLSALISWARSTLKSICSASATLRSTFKWTSLK